MSQEEIAEQKKKVLATVTAIQQYPDYVSLTQDEVDLELEGTSLEILVDYLDADLNDLKDLIRPGHSEESSVTREELEEVFSIRQLEDIEEILQRNSEEGDDYSHYDTSDDEHEEHEVTHGGKRSIKRRKKTCKRGTIRRRAYTRKNGTRVKSACIKDVGKPGKGKKLFTLKKGDLTKHGYSIKVGKERRQRALRKAKKHIPHATLIRKLNALAILFKNTKPHYAKRAKVDMEYLRNIRKQTQKKRR